MTGQEMLNQVIIELGNLNDGDTFIVKDLFKGYVWSKIDISERLLLGTLFLNYARQNSKKIKVLNKNSSGQQQYELIQGFQFKPISKVNCFTKTGVMNFEIINNDVIMVRIGTSGLDLCEVCLKSKSDIEHLSSILNHSLMHINQ